MVKGTLGKRAGLEHLAGSPSNRLPAGQKIEGLKEMTWSRVVYVRGLMGLSKEHTQCCIRDLAF